MGVVCRHHPQRLGSGPIQTDGHGSEFLEAPRNPSLGGYGRGPGQFAGWCVYLSELGQTHFTAVDLSRQNSCPSMSIVSEPLHVEQVVNRPDRPPALQGLGPATPWWAELGPDQWSPWHWNGPWAFFRDFPYVKPMNHQVSHGLFFGCLYPRDGARGWTATIEGHGNTRSHPS